MVKTNLVGTIHKTDYKGLPFHWNTTKELQHKCMSYIASLGHDLLCHTENQQDYQKQETEPEHTFVGFKQSDSHCEFPVRCFGLLSMVVGLYFDFTLKVSSAGTTGMDSLMVYNCAELGMPKADLRITKASVRIDVNNSNFCAFHPQSVVLTNTVHSNSAMPDTIVFLWCLA